MSGSNQNAAMVAVMGATGTGKSGQRKSSIIKLLTNDDNIHVGHNTESETSNITTSQYFDANARTSVTLIDTPGFDDSREGVTDTDILEKIAAFLQPEKGDGRKLNGIIYLHRISDPRVGGVSKRNLRMFRNLCGDGKLSHVRIVTTNWDRVSESEGSAREAHLAQHAFHPLIEGGASLLRHDRTAERAQSIIAEIIGQAPVMMQIQEELNDGRTLGATSAGAIITKEIEDLKDKHLKEMESLKKELADAVKAHDDALRDELAEERRTLEQRMARADQDRARLEKTLQEAQAKLKEESMKLREMQKKYEAEIASVRAEMANAQSAREKLSAETEAVRRENAEKERRDTEQEQADRLRAEAIIERREAEKRAWLEQEQASSWGLLSWVTRAFR